jgi:hypothetical protein
VPVPFLGSINFSNFVSPCHYQHIELHAPLIVMAANCHHHLLSMRKSHGYLFIILCMSRPSIWSTRASSLVSTWQVIKLICIFMLNHLISFLSCFIIEPLLRLLSSFMSLPTASELAFKKQAELACESLHAFNIICPLAASAPGPVKTALTELVTATVSSFTSSYFLKLMFHSSRLVSVVSFLTTSITHSFRRFHRPPTLPLRNLPPRTPTSSSPLSIFESLALLRMQRMLFYILHLPRKICSSFLLSVCIKLTRSPLPAVAAAASLCPEKGKKVKGSAAVRCPFLSFLSMCLYSFA